MKNLSATKLRIILLLGVAGVIVLQIGLIAAGQYAITRYGKEVASAVSVATSDEKMLQELESVSTILKQQEKTVKKSHGIIADKSNPYEYQNQIINDISTYAQKAGITVTGYTFEDTSATTAATPSSAASSQSTAAAPANTGTPLPAGIVPVTVTVNLDAGSSYSALYTFLLLLEGNLLQMDLQGLALSRAVGPSGTAGGVTPSNLTLQVYRQQ